MTVETTRELCELFDRTGHLCPPYTARDIYRSLSEPSDDPNLDPNGGVILLRLRKHRLVELIPQCEGYNIRIRVG